MDFQTNPLHSVRKRHEKEWTVVMHGGKKSISSSRRIKSEENNRNCGFTWAQLEELQHQSLIYRHIVARLPIPLHLLLPIWKTLSPTFATSFRNQYPSFIGFSPERFDRRNMMNPEAVRCRRTDGKKWRCSKNVVPDQKYCVQHMHRGRPRSRKLVEVAEISSSPSITKIPDKSKGELLQNSNSNISVSVGLQLMTTSSSNNTSVGHGSSTPTTSFSKKQTTNVTAPYITPNTAATTTTVLVSAKSNKTVGKDVGEKYLGNNCIIRRSNDNINVGRNMSSGLGFSPRSVLHLQDIGPNGLCTDYRNVVKLDPGGCRRTDGKKWRCRRDVVPDQKYCARHMHRGAKKLAKVFPPAATAAASSAARDPALLPPTMGESCNIDRLSPNTKLSISIPASPPLIKDGEKSNSNGSSDTTISDTSIAAYTISKVPS